MKMINCTTWCEEEIIDMHIIWRLWTTIQVVSCPWYLLVEIVQKWLCMETNRHSVGGPLFNLSYFYRWYRPKRQVNRGQVSTHCIPVAAGVNVIGKRQANPTDWLPLPLGSVWLQGNNDKCCHNNCMNKIKLSRITRYRRTLDQPERDINRLRWIWSGIYWTRRRQRMAVTCESRGYDMQSECGDV